MRWQLESSIDKDYIIERAKLLGWAENKVQVRREKGFEIYWYIIEPYEKDCNCPQILKYDG